MAEVVTTANQNNFLSRTEMLQWINDTLKISLKKIEHLGTGAIFCQLFDSVYPGKVQMQKVNWKAKYENEYMANFKILQQAFEKMQVNKPIEVQKLIKCKYQDNLEFLQWMKKYHDQYHKQSDKATYDPSAKRKGDSFCADHFTQAEKLPLPLPNSSNQIIPNLLDTSANGSLNKPSTSSSFLPPTPATSAAQTSTAQPQPYVRMNQKKNSSIFSLAGAGVNSLEKHPRSQSCQSSVSNISIDQDNNNNNNNIPESLPVGGTHQTPQHILTQTLNQQHVRLNNFNPSSHCFEKDILMNRLKDERDMYYKKIEQIDHMLDGVTDNVRLTPLQLKTYIKTILYSTRENILTINDDGTVTLTDPNLNPISLDAFETFEGLEQLQAEIFASDDTLKLKESKPISQYNQIPNIIPSAFNNSRIPELEFVEPNHLNILLDVNLGLNASPNGSSRQSDNNHLLKAPSVSSVINTPLSFHSARNNNNNSMKNKENTAAQYLSEVNTDKKGMMQQTSEEHQNNPTTTTVPFNPPLTGSSSFNMRNNDQEKEIVTIQDNAASDQTFQFEEQLLLQTNNDEDLLSDLEE